MGNVLALDTESTIFNKGNPYDARNSLVCFSYYSGTGKPNAALCNESSKEHLSNLLHHKYTNIVGFNFKFDYHWLSKWGIDLSGCSIWDVQLAEFVLSNQTKMFPSLDDTCIKYGIPKKKDVVKTEYWEKGINTDEIPWLILEEYAAHDAYITYQCYLKQREIMTPRQVLLTKLMCQDLVVLREMEATGLDYDEDLCVARSKEVDEQISSIRQKLSAVYPNVPINFSSNDDLSAFLYGGVVKEERSEMVGFYKGGMKAGQPKSKKVTVEHILPRLYTPLKGSALKKDGFFATDEATLKKLKGKKETVNLLIELSKLEKRNGTYYKGLVKLRQEMHWPKNKLHGQYNQCVAKTGRLSSSKPNQQNFDSSLQDIFISGINE
jgi:DNA polymerase I-like protein with 3'-5' exonuclease and polymerase domains